MNRRALLLLNRHARRGKEGLSEAVAKLQELGFDLQEESTQKPQQIPEIIRRYRDRVDLVIIGGGDGTLNAAAEGLIDTQLPLGILPLGTANDLARTLSIPVSLPEACEVIATGQKQRIDLGWVNGKHFFNVASLGLSVQITQQLTKEIKQRWGVLAYAVTAIQVIGRSRPFLAKIRLNGESIQVRTVQIAVGNGRYYGGGMTVADDATIDDQRLDVYSLEVQNAWQIVRLLPSMLKGKQAEWPEVRSLQGREIEVSTLKPLPINTDGEITTYTPAKFRLIPEAISVLVPQSPLRTP
ncbi:lipid kinase [Coleofasciculus sp. FACHB-SPT36]|uniref:lipid kinase n=1 Tax=Cyanophyceae TaxID=3028117 RepID=UPI00168BB295|nr:lipid kinase [Coleofasciculus sp. FACHB-SPT36]MBD2537889.1 lipid kinase [Coleofasciculus sp. FACHB-SPT36]